MVQTVERPRAARASSSPMPLPVAASAPIDGPDDSRVKWTQREWRGVAEALLRLFPELGLLTDRAAVGRVGLRHMRQAMELALERPRYRDLRAMTLVRPRLTEQFDMLREEAALAAQAAHAATPAKAPGVVPDLLRSKVIVALPDGANDGAPQGRIFWRPNELLLLAIEMLHRDPHSPYLETLIDLRASDVYAAQRVLPTSRRRDRNSLPLGQLRAQLAPVFQRLRAELAAERREQLAAEQAELARRAAEEAARQAAEREAAQHKLIRDAEEAALNKPEFVQRVLGQAPLSAVLNALAGRVETMVTAVMIESIVAALIDRRVKDAWAPMLRENVNGLATLMQARNHAVHNMPQPEAADTPKKPKVCVIGLHKSNHVAELRKTFGERFDLRLVLETDSLQLMKERARYADRTLVLTEQIGHKHTLALDAAKIPYEIVTGSIGRLKDYLSSLEFTD